MYKLSHLSEKISASRPPLTASLVLLGLLCSGCASSSSKEQQDMASQDKDGGLRARDTGQADRPRMDTRGPDLMGLGDSNQKPEGFHFWDAAIADQVITDRGPAKDQTANPDSTRPQDSQPAPDLPQGPDPGPVQCRNDGECGGTMTCNMSAPGGICSGCGYCPGWLECYSGFCVRECYNDGECNAGFRCSSTDRCVLRACDTTTPCPAPYACGTNGYCARPTCPAGSCPPPLICTNGLCIEP